MKKVCPILLLFLVASIPAIAQTARLFSPENGLETSQVNRVTQDRDGIVWFCTEVGLLRFDGMGFEPFRHDRENPYSIPGDSVHDLCEDRTGTRWVGTASGLSVFEVEYNTFHPFDLHDGRLPSSNQYISWLLEVPGRTGGSRLLVSTGGYGIYVIDTETRTLLDEDREKILRSLRSEYIRMIFLDAGRRLWIAQEGDTGIVILNADTLDPVTDVTWSPDLSPIADKLRVTGMDADPISGNILIGTAGQGLLLFDAATGTIRRIRKQEGEPSAVSALLFNPLDNGERTFLVGDENGGMLVMHAPSETLRPARLPGVRYDLDDKRCIEFAGDGQGNLWINLYQTGVMLVPRSMFGFGWLGFSAKGKPGENSACVMSVYEDPDTGRLWVATDGAGLFTQPTVPGTARSYNSANSGLTNNAVTAVTRDKRGTIWIGTYQDGLFSLGADGAIRHFRDPGRLDSERIWTLAYDKARDRLYVGTHGDGTFVVDPVRQAVTAQLVNEDDRWVSTLYIDRDGRLWIGTYNGPECYDPDAGHRAFLQLRSDGSPVRVYAISCDQDGTMWFGSAEGLFSVSADRLDIHQYTEQDGMPDNNVRDILCTPRGTVWFSTSNGLSCFFPSSDTFANFYASDGLQGNEFRSGSAFLSDSGRLYFGGSGGVTYFDPVMMNQGEHKVPQVRLSRLTVLDSEIRYDPAPGAENLTDKHISEATRIRIPAGVNLFSVTFSVPEYTNPQRIVCSYRLHGFDPAWKTASADYRVAQYTNVPPGRYKLEVRAFFDGAPDHFTQRDIDIRVDAPWYRRSWAYLLYLCLLGAIGAGLYEILRHRQQQKQERKDAELKELRLGLFTNLTHEIRTPLSLVMDPLRTLREKEEDPERKDTYNLMYRNCLRINRLVNQLMDLRKIDAGQMPMHFRETDLVFFIKDIMQSFLTLARSKRIDFTLRTEQPEEPLWIDQGNFDKIVFNILSNAFKHTPDEGSVRIGVSAPVPNRGVLAPDIREYVEVAVFNSGSRIEDAYISRIFDRFVQIDPYDANIGSGVGLNLTKMLVELHHGKISVENESDGVVFRVLVPVGKDHLTPEELSVTTHHKDLYVKGRELQPDSHEDETVVPEEEVGQEKESRHRKTVIVVEDDAEMREYLRSALRPDYQVTVCADGQEAWPIIATTLPDAVVTDLVMPGMSGSELCSRIRQNPSTNHIPVLVITGQDGEQEEQTATDSGADRFLSKPVSVHLLLGALAQAISARETVKAKFSPAMDFDYSGIEMGSADEKLLRRIVEAIRDNLENPEFDVAALCEVVGISRVHLNRKLKETGNVPPSQLIKSFRMKQAAYLLVNNKVNVSEVAYRVGFSSHSYFSSAFREFFGLTPKEFVAKYIDNPDDDDLKKMFE